MRKYLPETWRCFLGRIFVAALATSSAVLAQPIVFTQIEGGTARLAKLVDGRLEILSEALLEARDPDISFDGKRILFSGKRRPGDYWQVFEMEADGGGIRQVTDEQMDCRSPFYQSTVYVITADEPWRQIGFVGSTAERYPSLFSARPDGSMVRQITYNPHGNLDPVLGADGRVVFASRLRGAMPLFGVNVDGTDYATLTGAQGASWKRMPAFANDRLAVFVEQSKLSSDGAGWLAAVSLRRPRHSYRRLTGDSEGLFHSPAPAPRGGVLVARRPADGSGTFGIYQYDPAKGALEEIYDDPNRDDIQPKPLSPRPETDGRASVVNEEDPTGILYCLNVYENDLEKREWMPRGSAKRLRVIEGVRFARAGDGAEPPEPAKRLLGEVDVEADGSFNIRVPANIPIQLQLLDEHGLALRTCRWIWVRNKEPRGCIGCHEDPEMTPENRMVDAVVKRSIALTLPPERRRTVLYERDVAPIVARRCGNQACHGAGDVRFATKQALLPYVAGAARASKLVWHLMGRVSWRPWDPNRAAAKFSPMPAAAGDPLSEAEMRTIIEWIDLGAQ
ncbi:MAG: hypothetical protein GY953_51665 [bacterium]|nr:hypothetical protein [bacterium]